MLPRADMMGARPLAAIEAAKPAISVADTRQDVLQRLTQIAVGRMMQGEVLSRMNDGTFVVKLADTAVRMNLPPGIRAGDLVELTFVSNDPRPAFSLNHVTPRESHVSLSSAGRLIDSALRTAQKETAPAALVGKAPIVGTPTAPPKQLATALKDTLAYSGLFYESHVQQWAAGQRPLVELMREPQAKGSDEKLIAAALLRPLISNVALAGEAGIPLVHADGQLGASPHTQTLPHSDIQSAQPTDIRTALPADTAEHPEQQATGQTAHSANSPEGSSHETTVQTSLTTPAPAFGNEGEADTTPKMHAHGAATDAGARTQMTDTLGNEAARMISLQLDTLEQRRIVWQGELWPGQKMDWEVAEDARRESGNEVVERSWQSTVRFELPALGNIAASIRLTGQHLQVQVRTESEETAELLRVHGGELVSALDAAGSSVDLLTVKRDASL